jgi:hypothetical protein
MQKILQKIKYNQGSAALWIIIAAVIILAGGGAYYYFGKSNSSQTASQQPVSSNNQGNDNQTPQQTTTSGAGNACDYFTSDIAISYLSQQVQVDPNFVKYTDPTTDCAYFHPYMNSKGEMEDKGPIASIHIISVNSGLLSQSELEATYKGQQESPGGAQEISGIGDMAWYAPNTKAPGSDVFFAKGGTLIGLIVNDVSSQQANLTEAENIAKAIVQKLP